jgi:hypothetical protein
MDFGVGFTAAVLSLFIAWVGAKLTGFSYWVLFVLCLIACLFGIAWEA